MFLTFKNLKIYRNQSSAIIWLLFLLISCDQKQGPEEALKDFISYRFSSSQSREGIFKRVGGELASRLSEMNEEEFEKFLDTKEFERGRLRIHSSRCKEKTCSITYTLELKEKKGFDISIKKVVELVEEDQKWLINNVSNVKSYYEARSPLIL